MSAYESGDYTTAFKEFAALAEQGGVNAQFNLALMYEDGQGVPQDYKQAVKWYTKAAEQGDASAQHNLGLMYANGQGVPQDNVYAHMWSNLGAANGIEAAPKNRDIIAKRMTTADISKAQSLARECLKKNYKGC
uniref:tetratricopeptide repeat protein n=1 Tax=Algoriphagus sp. TaxID=1872435 RepID=UPI0040483D3E